MAYHKNKYYHEDLENLTEEVVFEEIDRVLQQGECSICTCPVCIQDIAAILLNKVPPIYCCSVLEKISPRDSLQTRLEEVRAMVRAEIKDAMDTVERYEHH